MDYIKKQEVKMFMKYMELQEEYFVINVKKYIIQIIFLKVKKEFQNVNVEE